MAGLSGVKPEEARCRSGGAERTGGGGLVEAGVVMRPAQPAADTAGHLHAGEEGFQQRLAAGLLLLGHGQRRGQHGDARVADKIEMRVVIVQRMRDRSVEQRSGAGRDALRQAEGAGLRGARFAAHHLAHGPADRLLRAGYRHGQAVIDGQPGDVERIGGKTQRGVDRQAGGARGDAGGWRHGLRHGWPRAHAATLPMRASEMMRIWISEVPSKILVRRASRQ
ncbi:hypothetical protein D3C81_1525830 [compost metagenome]